MLTGKEDKKKPGLDSDKTKSYKDEKTHQSKDRW